VEGKERDIQWNHRRTDRS